MKEKRNFKVEELLNKNAFQVLYEYALNHPNDPAIIYSADPNIKDINKKVFKNTITYNELIKNILNTYENLKKNDVKKGDIVIYSSITTPELIYTCYACIMMGAIFKSIDVRFSPNDILESFKQTPAKIFFCMEPILNNVKDISNDLGVDKIITLDLTETLPKIVRLGSKIQNIKNGYHLNKESINNKFIKWNGFNEKNSSLILPKNQSKSDDIINISATTGSTGKPKHVMYDSRNWNAEAYSGNKALPIYEKDHFFNCTVPWVTFGLPVAIHMFLSAGMTLEMDPLWTPELNAYYIRKKDPNWWLGAPGWLDDLFTNKEFDDLKLKNSEMFVCGGAPLFKEKHELYQNRLNDMNKENSHTGIIAPGYGMSEATAAISCNAGNSPYGTNGIVFDSFKVKVVEPSTFEECPIGKTGQLLVKEKDERLSPMFKGYLGMEDKKEELFTKDGWLKTGDLTRIIGYKDNQPILGEITRMKNILTYNGYNIDCDKIKEYLSCIPYINEVEVIESHSSDGNQVPLICVSKAREIEDEQLFRIINDILETELPSYYEYAGIEILDELPKKSMKIDKQKLKELFLDNNLLYIKTKGKVLQKTI